MRRWIRNGILLILIFFILCIMMSILNEQPMESEHQIKWVNAYEETASKNMVTAIYLDYRLFDTFLEATLLFVSAGGIIFMSKKDQDVT